MLGRGLLQSAFSHASFKIVHLTICASLNAMVTGNYITLFPNQRKAVKNSSISTAWYIMSVIPVVIRALDISE